MFFLAGLLKEAVLCSKGNVLKTPERFLAQLASLPPGDSSVYWLLFDSPPSVRANRDCVLAAVKKNGFALDVANHEFKADRDIVLEAVQNDQEAYTFVNKLDNKIWKDRSFVLPLLGMQGYALQYVMPPLTYEKEVVMAAVMNKGSALKYAHDFFKGDPDVVRAAVLKDGKALQYVHKTASMWGQKEFVLDMVKMSGNALSYVSETADMWKDKDFVLHMVALQGSTLQFVDNKFKADEDIVAAAVRECGDALAFVDRNASLFTKKETVLSLVKFTGRALEFASNDLKADKEVVLAAVRTTPTSVKFASAQNGLNQDPDLWRASGLQDIKQLTYNQTEHATLSVAFPSTDYATNFAVFLKRNSYLHNFMTHNPSAWYSSSCDHNLCRGTTSTCMFEETQNLVAETPSGERKPAKQSCRRFCFRYYLEKSRETNGFMIQVQEKHGLDDGQKLEAEMAQQACVKIFRAVATSEDVNEYHLVALEEAIKDWYKQEGGDMDMQQIQLQHQNLSQMNT